MDDELRQALKECKEEKKKEAVHLLFFSHGWTYEELSQVVNKPRQWIIKAVWERGK